MPAPYKQDDGSVVVVIGSGAGGGTVGSELAILGVDTVILEAGARHTIEDFVNDEWPSFGQLAWLDERSTSGNWRVAKDFAGLPAWIVKSVGGSTIHWAGASLRFQEHEWKAKTTYGEIAGANWDVKLMVVTRDGISEAAVIESYTYPLEMRQLYNSTGGTKGAFVVATNSSWGIDNADPTDYPLWCAFYDSLGAVGVLSCGATANNNVNIDVVGDMPTG